MNTKAKLIVAVVVLLLTGAPTALFWIQNAGRETGLSLNAGLFAVELANPVGIPALMAVTLGVGVLMGLVLAMLMRRRSPAPLPLGGSAVGASAQNDPWT